VAHFADVIGGGAELIATPEQGVQIMQMLDAIYASAESGQGIALT
jgi:predicted dehydrogenase